jgi:hypothetical protein
VEWCCPYGGTPASRVVAVRREDDTHVEMQPRFNTLCERLGTERDAHRRQVDLVRASLLVAPAKSPRRAAARTR